MVVLILLAVAAALCVVGGVYMAARWRDTSEFVAFGLLAAVLGAAALAVIVAGIALAEAVKHVSLV